MAEHLLQHGGHALAHDGVELRPAVPGDGGLERVGHQAERRLDARADADEGVAPGAHRAAPPGRRARPSSTRTSSSVDVPPARPGDRRPPGRWRGAGTAPPTRTPRSPATGRRRARRRGRPRPGRGSGSWPATAWPARSAGPPRSRPAQLSNVMPAVARKVGRAWMRIQASLMMPRMPSLPSTMRSGEGPAPEPGRRRDSHQPLRREHADRFHEVVDVGVVRGVVAARAGGDPAAERREAERLGEVAQREPVRPQLVLERGAEHPGLDAGRTGGGVDLEHPVEAVERDRDRAVAALRRVDPPDHRRPAPVGDGGVTGVVAPLERGLAARPRHGGGRRRRAGWGTPS